MEVPPELSVSQYSRFVDEVNVKKRWLLAGNLVEAVAEDTASAKCSIAYTKNTSASAAALVSKCATGPMAHDAGSTS